LLADNASRAIPARGEVVFSCLSKAAPWTKLAGAVLASALALAGCSERSEDNRAASTPAAEVRSVGGAPSAPEPAHRAVTPEASIPMPTAPRSLGERRVALVIGNARYPNIPLNNPENDARVVGRTLRGLGFEVTEHVNLPVRKFRQVLRDYVRTLQNGEGIGLLYYAGHGVQIDGRNYLLPVDINLRDEEEIKDEAVDIDDLFVSKLERAKTRGLIVILDACRDNPFRGKTRNIQASGGLAEMGARGALIAYAAAPGATAEDGPEGSNSVFTRHLVREMLEPGVEVETMFKNVRVKVLRDTKKRQMPWVNSSLTVDFQFNPHRAASGKDDQRQEELKRLQDLLDRREQQQRALEAQVKAMQRELEQKRTDQGAKEPRVAASPPAAASGKVDADKVDGASPARPEPQVEKPATKLPRKPPVQPPVQVASGEKAGSGKRTESERCVALQIRAQLGEPVSAEDLQKECRK
jgi:uncharacterized caspase-like protein